MRFCLVWSLALVLLCLFPNSKGANILGLCPYPSKSYDILMRSLLQALVKKGNSVTFVTPYKSKKLLGNFTNLELTGILDIKNEIAEEAVSAQGLQKIKMPLRALDLISSIISHKSVHNLIESGQKFDAVIVFWFIAEPLLGIADHFKAPIIAFSSVGNTFLITKHTNAPANPSFVPHIFLPFSDNMSFTERVANTALSIFADFLYNYLITPYFNQMSKDLLPNSRSVWDILEDIDLYLVNSNMATETPRPYMPNMIQIGGFFMEEVEELPEDLKKFMDDARDGIIYLSFGSNIEPSTLQPETKDAILKTFAKQRMKVLYKYYGEITNIPENVRVSNWLPQRSILAHPNVKLFITHGGLGGIAEATYFGVPMVGIPFMGDQHGNIATVVANECGIKVNFDNITEENLSNAVKEVLSNSKYKENIKYKSMLYRSQPMSQTEKAIYWIEHVIKHKGAKHLKSPSSKMPLFIYYLLDVFAFLLLAYFVGIIVCYLVFKSCFRMVFKKKVDKKKKLQ